MDLSIFWITRTHLIPERYGQELLATNNSPPLLPTDAVTPTVTIRVAPTVVEKYDQAVLGQVRAVVVQLRQGGTNAVQRLEDSVMSLLPTGELMR